MAHYASTSDPPDSSFRDRNRTKSTARRPNFAPAAGSEPAPACRQDFQNAQRSKNRHRLEFHRTAHSFPDYGSVEGAVRMPHPPGGMKIKGLAPRVSMNTLNSSPQCPTGSRQPDPVYADPVYADPVYADLPAPLSKRQKVSYTGASFSVLGEGIADVGQDTISKRERHGSQSSFAHSASPGQSEYQTVESSRRPEGRSNRRRRPGPTNRPPLVNQERRRDTESIESFEDIPPAFNPAAHQQRTARLISTTGPKTYAIIRDPADEYILQNATRPEHRFQGSKRGKKRTNYEITDDKDELGDGGDRHGNTNPKADDLARCNAASLSRKGDMNRTKWATKPSAGSSTSEARIDSAVCQPNLRWDGQTPCLLQQANGSELRAFTDDGNPAEPYDWLKIAGKVKSLAYHPDSNIIKIAQAMDQSSSVPVGSSMVVKFCSNADASWVAEWAQKHPAIRVIQEQDSGKLSIIRDRLLQEITQARVRAPAMHLSDAPLAHHPSWTAGPSSFTANGSPQASSQTPSHTPARAQMRVSAQQTPSLLQPEPYNDFAASTARSLRTRQVGQSRNVATPVTRRWSEEHNNWLKDWKMPLVLNRATVSKEDIPRLDEGECLNDNLIGYGLRYLFDKLGSRHPDLHKRVYLHNSFFYEKLKAGRGAINYDGVKSWTAKVDLLSYDYIVVPVNEHYHWWVAIICNPGKLDPDARSVSNKVDKENDQAEGKIDETSADVEMTDQTEKQALQSPRTSAVDELELVKSDLVDLVSDDRVVSIDLASGSKPKKDKKPKPKGRTYSTEDPRIITLDSMGGNHPQAISHLKKYLLAEFEHKRNKIIPDSAQPLGMKAVNLPEQSNLHDCGIYLLGYIMEFVKDPSQFIQTLLRKERPDWNFDASDLRGLWRDTIFNEHAMYQQHQPAKQSRRGASSANNTPNRSAQPSRQASQETSAVAHRPNGLGGERPGSTELSKTMATPLNFEARHLHGSSPRTPQPNGNTLPRPSATASGRSPQQTRPPQNQDDDVTILPPEEERPEAVIPSIESQEIEELPGPPGKWSNDEPKFIAELASSAPSESSEASDDHVTELSPKHFYTPSSVPRLNNSSYHHSNGNSGRNMRATMSSPASNVSHRAKTAMTRPVQSPTHTASRFVVAGSSPSRGGSDDVPVVQKAELVRQSEAIDLT